MPKVESSDAQLEFLFCEMVEVGVLRVNVLDKTRDLEFEVDCDWDENYEQFKVVKWWDVSRKDPEPIDLDQLSSDDANRLATWARNNEGLKKEWEER